MSEVIRKVGGIEFVEFIRDSHFAKKQIPISARISNSTYFGIEKNCFKGSFVVRDQEASEKSCFSKRILSVSKEDLPITITLKTRTEKTNYRSVVVLKDFVVIDDKNVGIVIDGSLKNANDYDCVRFKEEVSKLSKRTRGVIDKLGLKNFKDVVDFPDERFESVVGVGGKMMSEFISFKKDVCMKECGINE